MNLELTIQDMFHAYPTLFKERSDCLNHLFCVIGNGYDWYNGELAEEPDVDDEYKEYLTSLLVDGKAYQHNKMSLRDDARYYCTKRNPNDKSLEQYLSTIPDDIYHERPREKRWYFYLAGYCTKFAYLFNYPADIKPDWLAGIEECKAMLIEDGYDIEHANENPIDVKANKEERKRETSERSKKRNE